MTTIPSPFRHCSLAAEFGLARSEITPPVGVYARNWGAATHDVAESVHRPLLLSVLTIRSASDETPLILIDADLGWWKTPQTFADFRTQILQQLPVDESRLIFALSHTHAGPPLMQPDHSLPGSGLLAEWMEKLPGIVVSTVQEALDNPFRGLLDWHIGHCSLASVRDLPDPADEADRILCGYAPNAPADTTMLVGRISDSNGTLRATAVNYACHPTTLAWENTAISPDYPGAMRQVLQDHTGVPALFLLGACGELAPRYQYVGDPEVADRHGRQLAHAALATLADMEPTGASLQYDRVVESGAPLAAWRHQPATASQHVAVLQTQVDLPLKDWPTAAELEQQRQDCDDRALEERLRRKRDIRRSIGDGSSWSLPVHVWRLGDAVLVGCCCEPYSLLQRELRRRFPDRSIVCMNLINGSLGYLPPDELYDQDVYPVWQTPFARGCFESTLSTMTQAIEDVLGQ